MLPLRPAWTRNGLPSTSSRFGAAHFGRAVPLRLVVDGSVGGGGGPVPAAPDDLDPAEEVVDLDALVDAPSEPARSAVDRLTDAFPGAEVLEEGSR